MSEQLPTPDPLRRNFNCVYAVGDPEIQIQKQESSFGPYTVGDRITYTVDVINSGQVSLTGAKLYDSQSPISIVKDPIGLFSGDVCIPAGWTSTVIYEYVVTFADIENDNIVNTVCLSSNMFEDPYTLCASVTSDILQPAKAEASKIITSTGPYTTGDIITYQIDVTNTGDSDLNNVIVEDSQQPNISIVNDPANLFVGDAVISPGITHSAVYEYTITAQDALSGAVTNTALVKSNVETVEVSTTTSDIELPVVEVSKTITSSGPYTFGSVLSFRVDVTNPSNVNLIDVKVVDSLQPNITFINDPERLLLGGVTIPPNTTYTVTYNYIATYNDMLRGSLSNGVTVTSNIGTVEDSIEGIVIEAADIGISKTIAQDGPYTVGDVITYQIEVVNPSNIQLFNVRVTDTLQPDIVITSDDYGLFNGNVTLPGNTTAYIEYTYTVTQSDLNAGTLSNTAYVTSSVNEAEASVTGIEILPPGELVITKEVISIPPSIQPPDDLYILTTPPSGNGLTDTQSVVTSDFPISAFNYFTPRWQTSNKEFSVYNTSSLGNAGLFRHSGSFGQVSFNDTPDCNNVTYAGDSIDLNFDIVETSPSTRSLSTFWTVDADIDCGPPVYMGMSTKVTWDRKFLTLPPDEGLYSQGDKITYKVTATNIGGMPVTDIRLVDTLPYIDIQEGQELFTGGQTIAGGESKEAIYNYSITKNDIFVTGIINNTASIFSSADNVEDSITVSNLYLPRAGELSITKELSNDQDMPTAPYNIGDVLWFEITISNTGELPVRDLIIEDTILDENSFEANMQLAVAIVDSYQGTTINPDTSITIRYPYLLTADDILLTQKIENTALVTGLTGGDYVNETPERTLPVSDTLLVDDFNSPLPFVTEWEVESEGVVDFRLQYHPNIEKIRNVPTTGTLLRYSFWIDWGDGSDLEYYSQDEQHYSESGQLISHTYPQYGTGEPTKPYEISIYGTFPTWYLTDQSKLKITKQLHYGQTGLCFNALYYNCINFTEFYAGDIGKIPIDAIVGGTRGTTTPLSLYRAFRGTGITTFNFDEWDVSNTYDDAFNFYETFQDCKSLVSVDTTSIANCRPTTLHETFYGCENLASIDVSSWDVSNCSAFISLFRNCTSLPSPDCSNWDFARAQDTRYMFANTRFATLDTSNWYFPQFNTGGVASYPAAIGMFTNCINLTTLDVTNWGDMSRPDVQGMFAECVSINNLDTRNWSIQNISNPNANSMFENCRSLEYLNTDNWFTGSGPRSIKEMFNGCINLRSKGIGPLEHPDGINVENWNITRTVDNKNAFRGCRSLLQLDVSNWSFDGASRIENLFSGCSALQDPIDVTNWSVSSVGKMSGVFNGCSSLTTIDVSNWNTSNASSMGSMFGGCSNLINCDFSNFIITKVPDSYYSPTVMGGFFAGTPNHPNNQKVLADAYVNWDAQRQDAITNGTPFPYQTTFSAGVVQYDTTHNPGAAAARANLDGGTGFQEDWDITDGGPI